MKTRKPLIQVFEMMPREAYDEELEGLSFEEYLQKRNRDPMVDEIFSKADISEDETNFDDKIQYLIEAVRDLSTKKKEILELWEMCYRMLKSGVDGGIANFLDIDVYPLVSLTIEAKLTNEEKIKIDDALINAVGNYFDRLLEVDHIPFANKINALIHWYRIHNQFLNGLGLTNQVGTFKHLKSLIENNITDIEGLKSTSPITFINFIEVLKAMYKSNQADYKVQLKPYYLKKCLEEIIVARNSGIYDNYDQLLRDYYRAKLEDRPLINWCFDNLAGYGEKPWKLVWLFLGVNILFATIFCLGSFDFNLPSEQSQVWEKFLNFVYFNNTTMLTVGYGDIYPKGAGAKIVVGLLQIIGFAISGTAVALFLRKLLRF